MKKILDTNKPLVTSYPKYAHFFTIVGDADEYVFWIAKRFLLFHSYDYCSYSSLDLGGFDKDALDDNPYPYGPCINYYKIPFDVISFENQIVDTLVKYINQEYFICINICTSVVKAYTYELEHPILIIGYDYAKRIFYVNDFFPPTSNYRTEEIPFDEIVSGIILSEYKYLNLYKKKRVDIDIKKNIFLLKNILIENINKILYGNFSSYNPYYFKAKNQKGYANGIKVYDHLQKDINKYGRKGLHVLYDSKIIMYRCLNLLNKYFYISDEICNEYMILIDNIIIIRNLYLKYTLTRKVAILERINSKLKISKELEEKILRKILKEIE